MIAEASPSHSVVSERKIGFFIGLIEGEGSIGVIPRRERGGKYISSVLNITNTDLDLMEFTYTILKRLNAHPHLNITHPEPPRKTIYTVRVRGFANFARLEPIFSGLISEHRKRQYAKVRLCVANSEKRHEQASDSMKEALSLVQSGLSVFEVSLRTGISPYQIYSWLYRHGSSVKQTRNGFRPSSAGDRRYYTSSNYLITEKTGGKEENQPPRGDSSPTVQDQDRTSF